MKPKAKTMFLVWRNNGHSYCGYGCEQAHVGFQGVFSTRQAAESWVKKWDSAQYPGLEIEEVPLEPKL
jgi:hypothetical protein